MIHLIFFGYGSAFFLDFLYVYVLWILPALISRWIFFLRWRYSRPLRVSHRIVPISSSLEIEKNKLQSPAFSKWIRENGWSVSCTNSGYQIQYNYPYILLSAQYLLFTYPSIILPSSFTAQAWQPSKTLTIYTPLYWILLEMEPAKVVKLTTKKFAVPGYQREGKWRTTFSNSICKFVNWLCEFNVLQGIGTVQNKTVQMKLKVIYLFVNHTLRNLIL